MWITKVHLDGPRSCSQGFAAGDRFGVAVWNPFQNVTPFTLEVPGYALDSASEPGGSVSSAIAHAREHRALAEVEAEMTDVEKGHGCPILIAHVRVCQLGRRRVVLKSHTGATT
jgi:hypothetical protein